ncbi:unnamed protein product [Bemisia tabaci]|uniref:COP9 signalosome complex subunit 3 n=1 Tax=Bemisia tabaci TaxID=7038 RepID=A0A9N9ZZZ0_BEMTA|nr:PREDICTED: COP9 signalosome complex subunit 3 [Bemisia tabaci]CAH0381158.1 unnamed protein product [Bemisia tabaci]
MASPLKQFVTSIQNLSAQGSYREIVDMLNKSSDVLVKYREQLPSVLESLDCQQHSLGVLAVLCLELSTTAPMPPDTFEKAFLKVQEFLSTCNGEQIRLMPDSFAELCHHLTKNLIEFKTPMRGIAILQKAIKKLQMSSTQLTPVHADLCQLCLLAKNFKPALEFLDIDMVSIGQENCSFDAKYFLLYYYYGGMIYAAVKQYHRALFFFEVAITTPASAVSFIMLEAYHKYILISLIIHGKIIPFPKYTSQIVARFIRPLSQAYHDLATAYATNNAEDVRNCLSKYHETYVRDNNVGLTKQVLSSLFKKNIQRLTRVFLTLSLSDVATKAQLSGPQQAVVYLIKMIEAGEIFATINQKDGMVMFHDDPEKYNNPEMMKKLENEISLCMDLNRKINQMEEEIDVNPQYVKKANSNQEEDLSPGQGLKMSYSSMNMPGVKE